MLIFAQAMVIGEAIVFNKHAIGLPLWEEFDLFKNGTLLTN